MVWNLHDVAGFEERANEIRADFRGAETKVSELMAGRFFKQHGIKFAFRPPRGRKQDDFDIDYERIDGLTGRCEVKSKLQKTTFSDSTIKNSFKQAKKQLPQDGTGIVLLRTPEDWVPLENGVAKLQAIINAVKDWLETEKTKRISSVVVFDSRTDVIDSIVHTDCYYKEFKNPYCADGTGLPQNLLSEQMRADLSANWTRIPELVAAWEPRK
jgi:hypothetical protein